MYTVFRTLVSKSIFGWQFVSRAYHTTIPENAAIDTEVARVMATSLDTGINAQVVYSILGGNEHAKFTMDAKSGQSNTNIEDL